MLRRGAIGQLRWLALGLFVVAVDLAIFAFRGEKIDGFILVMLFLLAYQLNAIAEDLDRNLALTSESRTHHSPTASTQASGHHPECTDEHYCVLPSKQLAPLPFPGYDL
jgi:hypothetical protein